MATSVPTPGHQTKRCQSCQIFLTSHHIYVKCSSLHRVCSSCIRKCLDSGVVRCPAPGCGEKLDNQVSDDTESESLYIFVDHANIRIEAQKEAAIKHNLITREDPSVRLSITKVADIMAEGREVVRGTLYGSRSWSIHNDGTKLRERGWTVFTPMNNPPGAPQKQVDQKLVADVAELVSNENIKKATIIIASGDADVIPAIEAGLKKKWRFEIWAWKRSTSKSLNALQRKHPESVKVVQLDGFFEDITFINHHFNATFEPHLTSQTAVLSSVDFEPTVRWRKELSAKLGWPFEWCWHEQQIHPSQDCNLMLVLGSVVAESDNRNAKEHFEEIFQKLKEIYGELAKTYPDFQQQYFESIKMMQPSFEKLDEELINITQAVGAIGWAPVIRGCAGRTESSSSGYASFTSSNTSYQSTPVSRPSTQSSVGSFFLPIPKPSQQFCRNSAWCRYGLKCRFYHSEAEKEFFRNRLKIKLCHFGRLCNRGSRCAFAHSNSEAFCRKCNEWGHPEISCPAK